MDLIDEILNWVLSGGKASLLGELSKIHRDYLAELTQLARLDRESAWQFDNAADDDER